MLYIEDIFRIYWAPKLNTIQINNSIDLKNWLVKGNSYQVSSQIKSDEFEISVYDRLDFLLPISQDCNRFSTSSIESVLKIENHSILPKNISWTLIKQYYSAFYSAHCTLRMLGYSLSQLDSDVIKQISNSATNYNFKNGVNLENGYYLIDYSKDSNIIKFKKIKVKKDGGSHVSLWKIYGEKMKFISNDLLLKFDNSDAQIISEKLDNLISNLNYVGSNNYSWLSRIRNELNYKHGFGVWFPYNLPKPQVDMLKRNNNLWKSDLLKIELKSLTGKEIIRFSNTCQFIIGINNSICKDMSNRCPIGKSYLDNGFKKIINVA